MKWEKRGLIWAPSGELSWAQSHATLPVVKVENSERWAVYVGCRDADNKTRVGRLVLDVSGLPNKIPSVCQIDDSPILSLGEPGTFDDSGVAPSWLVQDGDALWLYYIGWNVIGTVPYRVSIGLAVSDDGGVTFRRYSQGPLVDRSIDEPFFASNPCVHKLNDVWKMWYISCTGWKEINGRWEPAYHVKYAESRDGIHWQLSNISCLNFGSDYAIARPCVFRHGDRYAMLYSYRSLVNYRTDSRCGYRLGYAESADGLSWERLDDRVGIAQSASGWDSEMIGYGWVQQQGEETYLLYNGNGFGRSGFGLAQLVG